MISVIIPTLNAERTLPLTLNALLEAHIDGLVREVIVADCGSQDTTARMAEEAGVTLVNLPGANTEHAISSAASAAKFSWLLILEAGTAPEPGFARAVAQYTQTHEHGRAEAAFFKFASYTGGIKGFLRNQVYALRSLAGLAPRPEQGLLIERRLVAQKKLQNAGELRFTELKARIEVLPKAQRVPLGPSSADQARVSLANR